MKDPSDRLRTVTWLVLIVANAAGVFAFRHFGSLDGPLHVLHAMLLEDRITGGVAGTPELHYDLSRIEPHATDLILVPLLRFTGPDLAHRILVFLVLLVLGASMIAFARAHHRSPGPMLVLLFPFTWSFLLVMGFYSFLLGVALCLLASAWWMRLRTITGRPIIALAAVGALLLFVHRGSPIVLAALLALHEAASWRLDQTAWRERWAILRTWRWRIIIGAVAVLATFVVYVLFPRHTTGEIGVRPEPGWDLITLRSLLLLDRGDEHPPMIAIGALLLLVLVIAAVKRASESRAVQRSDALLAGAVMFIVASFILRGPSSDLHYFSVRTQWMGLVLLMTWAVLQVRGAPWMIALAFIALAVHIVRLHRIERQMAKRMEEHACVIAAVRDLGPRSIVLPVRCGDDWLLRHEAAWIAAMHDGVVLDRDSRIWYARGTEQAERLRKLIRGKTHRGAWLAAHIASGEEPAIDHVVTLGPCDPARDTTWASLAPVVGAHYERSVTCADVEVFVKTNGNGR